MEHRLGSRVRIRLPVSVWQGNRLLGWFTSHDISNGGLSLRGRVDLSHNAVVTVSFEVRKLNRVDSETAKALVVHKQDGHFGLMWVSRGISLNSLVPVPAQAASLAAA